MTTVAIEPAAQQPLSDSHSGAGFFCRELMRRQPIKPARLLIAGCGAGHEAHAIQDFFETDVDAVDVEDFVPEELKEHPGLRFQLASVTQLPFPDDTFDAVFYHHVIEHVDDPTQSLHELRRVMCEGAVLFVGTPNRNRLISSVGAHQQSTWESTFANKLKDNLTDWRDRLQGRFRNECGAHAGFTRRELDAMLRPLFSQRDWVTERYLQFKYRDHRLSGLVNLAARRPWGEVLAPSIYAFCS